MLHKLLINPAGFPTAFNNVDIDSTLYSGSTKQIYIEEEIIKSINTYNTKLQIKNIIYQDISLQFTEAKTSKYSGAIVADEEIEKIEEVKFKEKGCFVFDEAGKTFARKIVYYVFISQSDESGRNGFVSQTVFPTVTDYIEDSMYFPCCTITGHPFLFINIMGKVITATSILRNIASMTLIGIDYIEVFAQSLNINDIPQNIMDFLKKFDSRFDKNYEASKNMYDNDYYTIDFTNKSLSIKSDYLITNTESTGTTNSFKGSSEKFYWIEIYPIITFALKQKFQVDYSEFQDYCDTYEAGFGLRSDKFARCKTLLKYFKKMEA